MTRKPKALTGLSLNSLKCPPFLGLVKDQAAATASQPLPNNHNNILRPGL